MMKITLDTLSQIGYTVWDDENGGRIKVEVMKTVLDHYPKRVYIVKVT